LTWEFSFPVAVKAKKLVEVSHVRRINAGAELSSPKKSSVRLTEQRNISHFSWHGPELYPSNRIHSELRIVNPV
jgi:hypothetical protein